LYRNSLFSLTLRAHIDFFLQTLFTSSFVIFFNELVIKHKETLAHLIAFAPLWPDQFSTKTERQKEAQKFNTRGFVIFFIPIVNNKQRKNSRILSLSRLCGPRRLLQRRKDRKKRKAAKAIHLELALF
jgi:hypothetical protein